MKPININIEKFASRFSQEYSFLYANRDRVAGFREAVEAGDRFIRNHPEFVAEFCNYRGDLISSDREVAAFAFTLDAMIPSTVVF